MKKWTEEAWAEASGIYADIIGHPFILKLADGTLPTEKFKRYIAQDELYLGGRAGTLIYIVNELGGLTIIPELHKNLILFSLQQNLRPIVNPVVSRNVSLYIRKDYIHEQLLNIIVESICSTIPLENLDDVICKGRLVL